jgi:hypothetical protein
MKALAVGILVLSSLAASAQTVVTTTTSVPMTITLNTPCANHGKGLTLTFSGKVQQMFHEVLVNGTGHGGQFYVANKNMTASAPGGVIYYATGTHDGAVLNFTPFNPDHSLNSDGDYTYVDDFFVYAWHGSVFIEQFLVRHTQAFSVTNNGNNLSLGLDETVCK